MAFVLDHPVHQYPRRSLITALLILGGLLILTIGTMPWDLRVSFNALKIRIPGDLRRLVQFGEVFAHSAGCVVILGSLLWIDVKNRPKLWKAVAFVALCATIANAAKYFIPRSRPNSYKEFVDHLFPKTSWETFGSPLTESWFDEALRSFPSGHSATALAMAIGLTYVYPRGRWVFLTLAVLAMLQRLFSGAHYASDILAGVTITVAIAFSWMWLASRRHARAAKSELTALRQNLD
jgi:membrane-associated phospholipid phosphatase